MTAPLGLQSNRLGLANCTIHDLRHTFTTWHSELGTPLEILDALLNHAPKGVTERVYNQPMKIEPRKRAMTAYCNLLERVLKGDTAADNVVMFPGHGR